MVLLLFRYLKMRSPMCVPSSNTLIKMQTYATSKKNLRKTIAKREDVKKIRMNILQRYLNYIKNYDKTIEKKFPTAMNLYRTFKGGIREFYVDLKMYISIVAKLNKGTGGLASLTLKELEVYFKLPKDIIKVTPVLAISIIPFSNYIVFPLAFYFPRQLLCHHFWTLQQRVEFQTYYLRTRLSHQRPVFRCLQSELSRLKKENHMLFKKLARVLGLIGSGIQPQVDDILECKEFFSCPPCNLSSMKPQHVKQLLKLHGMSSTIWFRRTRLADRAKFIKEMDRAIERENGPQNLSLEHLRFACYVRGLNPVTMRNEDMIQWLSEWLKVSKHIDYESASLLLHCPILLAYNLPTNWKLIYN